MSCRAPTALALGSLLALGCFTPTPRTGLEPDAGAMFDAGLVIDASSGLDAGTALDAGIALDAGVPRDAGSVADASTCTPIEAPSPAPWTRSSTGGPAGESVSACLARGPRPNVDPRIPQDQRYELTTFGGGTDTQPVSCGGMQADGTWYYAAGAQRFSCGQRIRLVDAARTHCVVVQVADLGPNLCVEAAGGAPIWDISPLAARHLYGGTSYGWSEHVGLVGAPVGSDSPLGPCDPQLASPAAFLEGFVGGPCRSDADCRFAGGVCRTDAQGFPGGHCTAACASFGCPDQAGPNAFTGCADPTGRGEALCAARCDHTLFPETGCRDGYGCFEQPHPTNPTAPTRRVCVPLPCAS